MEPVKITPTAQGIWQCPRCASKMSFIERQPVSMKNGKLVMEESEAHYLCKSCNSIYRRIVSTDYYQWHKGPAENVKNLETVRLVKDSGGTFHCPLCTRSLRYIEGQPLRIVNGKVDMSSSEGYNYCDSCKVSYRKLLNTNYYQGSQD